MIPVAHRNLGLHSGDTVVFSVQGDDVRIHPPPFPIDPVLGSVPSLRDRKTDDFEDQTKGSGEEAADRYMTKGRPS